MRDPREGLALEGDLSHFFPTEVLQLLQLAQANGRLELERSGEHAELFIERGRPVFARTDGQAVKAGQILVHRGLLTRDALELALAVQEDRPGQRLGTLLVESGVVTPDQLQSAVQDVIKRIVYGVMLWRAGRFRFYPGERVQDEDIQLDLEVDRMILEGLRFADQQRADR
jgi:glycine/D-amino acid oxidase-like deaminating enzyme